jgi:transposase
MGFRKISTDLLATSVRIHRRGRDTKEENAAVCNISKRTLERALVRVRETGTVAHRPPRARGRPKKVLQEDIDYLVRISRYKPSTFLREYCSMLGDQRYLDVHITTIHRALERAGISLKKLQKIAAERDPLARADYIRRVSRYRSDQLVFIDEVSKDDRTYARHYGRAPLNERAQEEHEFVRHRRFSMCAAMALDRGIVAARVVEGSFDQKTFDQFIHHDTVSHQLHY